MNYNSPTYSVVQNSFIALLAVLPILLFVVAFRGSSTPGASAGFSDRLKRVKNDSEKADLLDFALVMIGLYAFIAMGFIPVLMMHHHDVWAGLEGGGCFLIIVGAKVALDRIRSFPPQEEDPG